MVGVAGKSRGCATCRSRKIKKDLGRPQCWECTSTRRVCRGYDRYPVFVHTTVEGVQKRQRLEEVKDAGPENSHSSGTALNRRLCASRDVQCSGLTDSIQSHIDFVQWFHHAFVLTREVGQFAYFMTPIVALASPGPLLRISLLALSMTKYGRVVGDFTVVQRGQQAYVYSLRRLHLALSDPVASKDEGTLACAVVLGFHELLEEDFDVQSSNWRNHMTGIERLLEHRGPDNCQTPISRMIFEHCRKIFMMRKLAEAKDSIFGEPEWLEVPWIGLEKDPQQIVCDFGLRLSNLLARKDKILVESGQECSMSLSYLTNDLFVLFEDLRAVHRGCSCFHFLLFKENETSKHKDFKQSSLDFSRGFDTALISCIMIMGMQLACCLASDVLHNSVRHSSDNRNFDTHCRLSELEDQPKRRNLALMILHLSEICAKQSLDPGSLVRISWAIGYTKQQLDPLEAAFTQCEELLEKLETKAMPVAAARLQGKKTTQTPESR